MRNPWVVLLLAIATSVGGQALLKAGAARATFLRQLFDAHTMVGLGLYAVAAMFYIISLRKLPLSVALPCTALSYVAAAIIGHYAFAENVGILHLFAIALIVAGVALLSVS